ncbi:hypothetical protein BofuT4_uP113610.1 [Botrytis cinerea T4]|uniref:Uncharacterized protein n=1 Tax=Botryotinia fuckeliana (strain T4) TaxID=999810 RepID=G2Y5B7_BOTF4|nr:hypothetical protein BofuT4_uP113610.1 [Botrytis cinerea T4]
MESIAIMRSVQPPEYALEILLLLRALIILIFLWTMVVIWSGWYNGRLGYQRITNS